MKHSCLKRTLAALLACAMVLGLGPVTAIATEGDREIPVSFQELDANQVSAELFTEEQEPVEEPEPLYEDTDLVRATIVLEEKPAMDVYGLETASSRAYRTRLKTTQDQLAARISHQVLDGEKLDVVWNLTLAENAISANVAFGKLEEIRAMSGVQAVYLETRYEPMTAVVSNVVAQEMTGASAIQADSGYTGAGVRIAVIDTGTDTDHQSFDLGGYLYSLARNAEARGMSVEAYTESLNLLDKEEIAGVLEQLHVAERYEGLTADDLYLNEKLPFNFNYVDYSLDVTHDNDTKGEHGSHVAGIATANEYIPADPSTYDFDGDGDLDKDDAQALLDYALTGKTIARQEQADISGNGTVTSYDAHLLLDMVESGETYAAAEKAVGVTGVAPDAQLLTMKVFGNKGGAYSSDYMAAVEDAILLGCTAVNLSLGAPYPGFRSSYEGIPSVDDYINSVMEKLSDTGLVMCAAAGNDGNWADEDGAFGLMYTDEAGTSRVSSPSTYANALSVASVDNIGAVLNHETHFGGSIEPTIEETANGKNEEWATLDPDGEGTTYDVVFLGDPANLFAGKTQDDQRIYAGNPADFDGFDFTGKIVLIARGNGVYFSAKHEAGAAAGAAAVLIYNNVPGAVHASIEESAATIPCNGLSMEDAAAIFALCEQSGSGMWETTVTVKSGIHVNHGENTEYLTMSDFSSWGTTGSLTIKPEITAPGGSIYSVNGLDKSGTAYEVMSGTSMATPHITGLTALAAQYFLETGLVEKAQAVSGLELSQRNLLQSLLMSTAVPILEEENGVEYSVRNQGAGLANVEALTRAESFLLVEGQPDGKVKAELGDGTEGWSFSFDVYNLSDGEKAYTLDASILTTDTVVAEEDGKTYNLTADQMVRLGAQVTYSGDTVEGDRVTLPASGSARVTVEIRIPAKAQEQMKALGYDNGFYVEGFVYLRPVADAEGCLDVTHSIPLLGFFGDWSAPSMYDTGSFIEMIYGDAQRPSHVPSTNKNVISWCPKDFIYGYSYTGNIYGSYTSKNGLVGDQHYYPQRNALSSLDSRTWEIFGMFPSLIRNAGDIEARITDAETGKVYFKDDYEYADDRLMASFFYTNFGQWYNTTGNSGISFQWDFTDPETGETVPEGTKLRYSVLCAPEYFVDENGIADFDKLSDGVALSMEFTVDNTAPRLVGDQPLTLSADGNTLYYTAKDENYIAAVLLLNGTGTAVVGRSYPDMSVEQGGKPYSGGIDLTGYREKYGGKAVFAVCDYAGNETYYAVNLNGEGNSYGHFLAYQYRWNGMFDNTNSWVSFDTDVDKNESSLFETDYDFVCAEYVSGYVFAQTKDGSLYGIPYENFLSNRVDLDGTFIVRLENVYQDFAFNYADGNLYGLTNDSDYTGIKATINKIPLAGNNAYTETFATYRGKVTGLGLACDDAGSMYVLLASTDEETGEDSTAQLWKSTMNTSGRLGAMKLVGDTGLHLNNLQAMTWDHNTETLYWARFNPVTSMNLESDLLQVNPETAECTKIGTLSGESTCLVAPLSPEAAAMEAHANTPVLDSSIVGTPVLRDSTITLNVGATQTLVYGLDPWYTSHRDVIWSCDDESVATVDENGLVTAVSIGSCTVTLTSRDDPSKFDTCTILVAALDLQLEGIVSDQDEVDQMKIFGTTRFSFDMDKGASTYQRGEGFTWPEAFQGFGTSIDCAVYGRGSLWVSETGNAGNIYEIDPETGVVKDRLDPVDGVMAHGMSYSEATDYFTVAANYSIFVDQPFTHEAIQEMLNSRDPSINRMTWHWLNLSSYLAASDKNYNTGEKGNGSIVNIVICGITNIDGMGPQKLTKDYLGGYIYPYATYTPDTTLVLLDNVGRFWYIDEITGMKMSGSNFVDEAGEMKIGSATNGVLSVGYDTDENGEDDTYSVFVIREIHESPLTDMYLDGTMPRITYHFSDIEYAGALADGTPMFALSLYGYWDTRTSNELYLYIPGNAANQSPERLYHLGETDAYNVSASIYKATVTGGLEGLTEIETEAADSTGFIGWYKPE